METTEEKITGAQILRDNMAFDTRVLYMTEEQHVALALFDAATHVLDAFTTVPRALALAPKKQSGKTTLLNVIAMLGHNAWMADPTGPALRSKFNEQEKPLVMIDEISEYYGKSGLRQGPKDLNKILLEGYAKNAKLALSVDRSAVDISSFCFAAMGGLMSAVREDVRDRAIVWNMSPIPASVRVEDVLSDDIQAEGKVEQARLHQWARENQDAIKDAFRNFKRPHRKMASRLRQVWGPLYAVALVAGEEWPERCVTAFKTMALDSSEQPVLSTPQMILRDTAGLFASTGADKLFARDIAAHLRSLAEVDYYQDVSNLGLAKAMTRALGESQSMDVGTARAKGFHAAPAVNAWAKLEAALEPEGDEDDEDDEFEDFFEVTDITGEQSGNDDENDPPPGGSPGSRKSRVIGVSAQDLSKAEPEVSPVSPPCNDDVATLRRRKVQTAAGQGDAKFLVANMKEK